MSTSQINTPIGIPSELSYGLPSSMVPSRKYELRVQPYGNSQFSTPGQAIRLVLPQTQRTLYNFQTGYLMGTVKFTHGAAAAGAPTAAEASYLLGSWYSMFNRQVIRCGGYVLETIDRPGELVNAITSMTMNPAERSTLNNSMGFNPSAVVTNLGVKMNVATGANDIGDALGDELNFTFAIPLIGLLNNTKFFPAWNGDLEIELTLNDFANYITSITAGQTVTAINITNVEYVVECLELSPESYNMVMAQSPDNKIVLKSQTYSYGSSTLAAQTGAGTIDIPWQIKVNSLKQIIWYSQPVGAAERSFAGVNPNLDNYSFICNGQAYPVQPVKARFPSEAFMQNQKAFGSTYSSSHSGSCSRFQFNTASTAYNLYHRPYNATVDVATLETAQRANKWFQCLDLETINSNKESLYNGISTSGTSSQLRLNIAVPLANAVHNVHMWSCHDAMIVLDGNSGITSVVV